MIPAEIAIAQFDINLTDRLGDLLHEFGIGHRHVMFVRSRWNVIRWMIYLDDCTAKGGGFADSQLGNRPTQTMT